MKNSYPIILTPADGGYVVFIPDFQINTEGDSLTEAIEMARDAIGLMGIDMEDDGKPLPAPSTITALKKENAEDILTLVDVSKHQFLSNPAKRIKKRVTHFRSVDIMQEDVIFRSFYRT